MERKKGRHSITANLLNDISSKVTGSARGSATEPPPRARIAKKLGFVVIVLTLFRANTILYGTLTTPGKVNLHHKLTGELTMTITTTILHLFMFVQCLLLLMCGVCGTSRCFKNIVAFLKITTVFSFVYASITYYTLRTQQNRYQQTMLVTPTSCQFPEYFPGWLWPPFLIPFIHSFLTYHYNEPWHRPIEPQFATLELKSPTAPPSPSNPYHLSFADCQPSQGKLPSYQLHPIRVLSNPEDIPPIGSGMGDYGASEDGMMNSLLGVASITKEEGQRWNVSRSTPLPKGESSVLVDNVGKPPVGLVQAFCKDTTTGTVEERALPHVPELPRLRQTIQQNKHSPPSCPFSLTVVLIDSVSRAKAMRVWPKFWAKLNAINAGQKDSHLRTAQKSTPTTPTTPTTTGSAVFNFARFHALGAFDWHHIATGFNIRALYTGRGTRTAFQGKLWHRPRNETTAFWEEMRAATGHASWFAQGMCSNYGFYFDRSQVWTDMAFEGVGCHIDYDQGGASGRNFNGPYSIFPRYVANVPVHRHLFKYPRLWRQRYGPSASLPTVGVINLLEAHEGLEQVVKTMDEDLVALLTELQESGALDDTMVVFLADHGNNMGAKEMWKTESWIEKTHPFLTMVVPQALLDRIPGAQDTLTKNTQRLVTMYDVHRTFLSMCSVEGGVESSNGKQTMVPTRTFEVRPDHGDGPYSFFHEEVPVGRTCHDALVPEIICECSSDQGVGAR